MLPPATRAAGGPFMVDARRSASTGPRHHLQQRRRQLRACSTANVALTPIADRVVFVFDKHYPLPHHAV